MFVQKVIQTKRIRNNRMTQIQTKDSKKKEKRKELTKDRNKISL